MPPTRASHLRTRRLLLRPTEPEDAGRALEIRSNWNVARNLSRAAYPPDGPQLRAWFAGHAAEWRQGTAYRFAILHDGRLIGIIDIGEIEEGEGELGYWLDEPDWGRGFGFEAARAVVDFGFGEAGLAAIRASRASDNIASQRILHRLGFVHTGDVIVASRSRATDITQCRYRLERAATEQRRT